jgi:hypothetical protein
VRSTAPVRASSAHALVLRVPTINSAVKSHRRGRCHQRARAVTVSCAVSAAARCAPACWASRRQRNCWQHAYARQARAHMLRAACMRCATRLVGEQHANGAGKHGGGHAVGAASRQRRS